MFKALVAHRILIIERQAMLLAWLIVSHRKNRLRSYKVIPANYSTLDILLPYDMLPRSAEKASKLENYNYKWTSGVGGLASQCLC